MNETEKYIGTKLKSIAFQAFPDCITLGFEEKNNCSYSISFTFPKILWETCSSWVSDDVLGHIITEIYIIPNQLVSLTLDNNRKLKLGEETILNNVLKLNPDPPGGTARWNAGLRESYQKSC